MRMRAIGATAALAALLSAGAQAAKISVVVTATPSDYTGPCPVTITFKAAVTLDGPGKVTYKWKRSDWAIDPELHAPLVFAPPATPSTLYATTTWKLGAAVPAFQPFNGWEKIELALEATLSAVTKLSDPANFKINCQQGSTPPGGGGGQGKPDLIPALHKPMDGWVEVRNMGTAPAGPSRLLIKCAKAGSPDGGGCADLPPATAMPAPWSRVPEGVVLNVPSLAPVGSPASPASHFMATAPFWAALVWNPGTYNFTAIADYYGVVPESNEGNNIATSTLVK